MKPIATISFCFLAWGIFGQRAQFYEFGLGSGVHLVESQEVNQFMQNQNPTYGDAKLQHGFGLQVFSKYCLYPWLKLGVSGQIQRSYASSETTWTAIGPFPESDTSYATGHSEVQLSNYSYGITADIVVSRWVFPDWNNAEISINTGVHRSHVFLRDQIFNPFYSTESYLLNHLGVSWTYQFELGFNYRFEHPEFFSFLGIALQFRFLESTTLRSRVYGSEWNNGMNDRLEVGAKSIGLGITFGIAR